MVLGGPFQLDLGAFCGKLASSCHLRAIKLSREKRRRNATIGEGDAVLLATQPRRVRRSARVALSQKIHQPARRARGLPMALSRCGLTPHVVRRVRGLQTVPCPLGRHPHRNEPADMISETLDRSDPRVQEPTRTFGRAQPSKAMSRGLNTMGQLTRRVDNALDRLAQARIRDTDVHEARKSLKKARACLRLLRPGLKTAAYRLENAALRDAARPLSAVRDAAVLCDTVHRVAKRAGDSGGTLKLDGLTRVLRRHRARVSREVLSPEGNDLANMRRLLRQSRGRIAEFALQDDSDWTVLGPGLMRVYAQGRRALARARATSTPAAFHAWRKQAKYLRYALEILQPLWPGLIGELVDQTHALTDYLGEAHDLTVLRESVRTHPEVFDARASRAALLALIDRRESELREKATFLGARVYEEKPKAFARRFGEYWKEWHEERTAA